MLLPLSWLKEFVDIDGITPDELEKGLFESGFEVEEKKYLGAEIENCVVGQIKQITKHPDSDHLQICILDCTEKFGNEIQIVTGAQNVFEGAKVPVALHGACLAGGIKIKNGKLRGVPSNGMLCSGGELGITEDFYPNAGVDGILILPESTPLGADIRKVVGLDDWVFDISITANRPDAESILGIAREVATIFNKKINHPAIFYSAKENLDFALNLDVQDTENCPKYLANVVQDIKIAPSPVWLRQRLIKCGAGAINNIVDITNYVRIELGQPMHAFDHEKLANHTIIVRAAKQGEVMTALDEKEYALSTKNLVIADANGAVALAGIMGGLESGVQETTKTIVFESAKFMRESVRKTSRALGLASDSSHRFEKGVDEYTTSLAMQRALHLVEALGAGVVTTTQKSFVASGAKNAPIKTTIEKINAILGIDVPAETIADILKRLGFEVDLDKNGNITATAPEYRKDVDGVADLAEEVIRIYGYKHITPRLLTTTQITKGGLDGAQQTALRVKNALVAQGFNEMVTYSFYGKKDLDLLRLPADAVERNFIEIQNPLTEDIAIMRTTLVPSALDIITKNFKKGIESGKIFELANAYFPKERPITSLPRERQTIVLGAWGEKENFFTMKGYLENLAEVFGVALAFEPTQKSFLHPYRSASIIANGKAIGVMGQVAYDISEELSITPHTFVAEIDYDAFAEMFRNGFAYKPVSKHPSIKRDLAVVVQEGITSGQVVDVIKNASKKVATATLFDVYRGDKLPAGSKSLAFNLVFEAGEDPITHEEVDAQIKKILNRLNALLGATLRQ
ncbi:MAG: phenylalanine--tRNA ligase subunit beta [Clostridia bacterium]|nr:phenylalanine--tRNA ligase subunit beta [Clostridia bacterium]